VAYRLRATKVPKAVVRLLRTRAFVHGVVRSSPCPGRRRARAIMRNRPQMIFDLVGAWSMLLWNSFPGACTVVAVAHGGSQRRRL
jgi:hypothetical protein